MHKQHKGTNLPNANNSEMGPIGLLAEELAINGCCLNDHLEITQVKKQPVSITRTPWQDLKRQVEGIVKRQRIKNATERKTDLGKLMSSTMNSLMPPQKK